LPFSLRAVAVRVLLAVWSMSSSHWTPRGIARARGRSRKAPSLG
jgi:hypothetical protein